MQRKTGWKRIAASSTLLIFLMLLFTIPVVAETNWQPEKNWVENYPEQVTFVGLLAKYSDAVLDSTPFPPPTTQVDSCASCEVFDMEALSITLTAVSANLEKPAQSDTNPGNLKLVIMTVIIATVILVLVFRFILPKFGISLKSKVQEASNTPEHPEPESGGSPHLE